MLKIAHNKISLFIGTGLLLLSAQAFSHGDVTPQVVDTRELKQLGEVWKVENPYRADAKAVNVGKSAYNQNCARCHGETGHGDGPDAAMLKEQLGAAPTNFHTPAFKARERAEIRKAIADGGAAVGLSEAMPPWSSLFEDKEIDALADHVRNMPVE